MFTYVGAVWLLTSLAGRGSCLVCEVCTSFTPHSCRGTVEVCNSMENSCIATLTESALGSDGTAVFQKSCGNAWECSHPASMAAGTYRVRAISKCCDTDYCNNGTIDWQPMNDTANGKVCPSCLAENSQDCQNTNTISCTGEETQCVKFTATKHRGSQITFIGCATQSMCDSKGKLAFPGTSLAITDFSTISMSGKGPISLGSSGPGNSAAHLTGPHRGLCILIGLLLLHLLSTSPS
ncbi:phospholipase A2 inhibitor and Ly6/PLAUR domain-containing protein-like [Lissotriton helveticus]